MQQPIIPVIGDLIVENPGTISLGQGIVHYPPPAEVEKNIRDFWRDATARAHPHDALDAELDELLNHDRRRGAAHPACLYRDGLAVERPREAEHAALAVDLGDVVEVGVGEVFGAERVAGDQTSAGVVAGLSSQMDRHGATP